MDDPGSMPIRMLAKFRDVFVRNVVEDPRFGVSLYFLQ